MKRIYRIEWLCDGRWKNISRNVSVSSLRMARDVLRKERSYGDAYDGVDVHYRIIRDVTTSTVIQSDAPRA